jgi:cobalt-zinc-cadmium efflux system outer membrane protein
VRSIRPFVYWALCAAAMAGCATTSAGAQDIADVARQPHAPAPAVPSPDVSDPTPTEAASGVAALVDTLEPPPLRRLVTETLDRNPEVAELVAAAGAAAERAPQVKALPDPVAGVTAYLQTPETRVGPQQAMVSLSQRFPWFGKLRLREQAALSEAAAARARVEAARLRLVTEVRRLAYEIAFQDAYEDVVHQDRATLAQYEEVARARYASGVGVEQGVIKIQAEITKDDARLLDIAARRAALRAQLNALRDRPDGTPVPVVSLPAYPKLTLALAALRQTALTRRPEIAGADAAIATSKTMVEVAHKDYSPDLTLGLVYGLVGKRTDPAGRAAPPPDNGQDVFGVTAGVNLPVGREKRAAGVKEAGERELAAEQAKRSAVAAIDRSLDDLAYRIPLTHQRLDLFAKVLAIQADQSLRSAEAGYAAGTLNALDLLDAERVLLEVHTATVRARADYAIAVAQLEGAIAAPVVPKAETEQK